MNDGKKSEAKKKLLWFCLGGVVYLSLLLSLLYLFFRYGAGLLLFYMPLFIFASAFIGVLVWFYKFYDKFEAFLVYVSYVCFGFSFVFLVPFAVERSLSTFILFYAAQHDGIPQIELSQNYKNIFFKKRFDDALKGNFLVQEGDVYKPTFRTKLYYGLLYPLGKVTDMLGNYELFEKEIDETMLRKFK